MQASVPLWVYLLSVAIGPAVGGIIALLGAFGGPWVKARTDVDQWRRDKRLDGYADLARTVHELIEAMIQRRAADGGPLGGAAQENVMQAMYGLLRATGRARLLGPPNVRNAAVELAQYVNESTALIQNGSSAQQDELTAFDAGLESRYDAFMDAARRDLGVQ